MYEDITYEDILQRMLDKVPEGMDKREGSIIYDALAPAAVELQLMYIEFGIILQETFADTASREYLIRRAKERGLIPYPASFAILKAVSTPSNVEVPIGAKFSLNDLNYIIKEKLQNGEYQVICEKPGAEGNKYFGSLIPVDYIQGLETIKITEILIPGEDEENTEEFRERYFATFETKGFGGNKKDYIQKTNAIAGVGATKVTPVWNGGGTVLITILNGEFNKASSTLIKTVQEAIDPDPQGQGVGIAPIGHTVTVRTVDEVTINISTRITFQEGYSWNGQKNAIREAIQTYMLEIRKAWANEPASVVRISQIETRILNLMGVIDISDTKINESTNNLTLDPNEIPILGAINNG